MPSVIAARARIAATPTPVVGNADAGEADGTAPGTRIGGLPTAPTARSRAALPGPPPGGSVVGVDGPVVPGGSVTPEGW